MTQLERKAVGPITNPFDALRRNQSDGKEYWSARELGPLLGYDTWRNFADSVERARAACDNSGQDSRDHIVGTSKMITVGKGAEREVLDYHLTRYAAYLVAMNSDARKPEIANAQTYFAVQTRRAEVAQLAAPVPMALPSYPEALRQLANSVEMNARLEAEKATLAPKADAFDALMDSDGLYSVSAAAKILHTGELRLFELLRQRGVLMDGKRSGKENHNIPYQPYIDRGYFELKTKPFKRPDGQSDVSRTTMITTKGLEWLRRSMQQQGLLALNSSEPAQVAQA